MLPKTLGEAQESQSVSTQEEGPYNAKWYYRYPALETWTKLQRPV